jgi:hypothetical protein
MQQKAKTRNTKKRSLSYFRLAGGAKVRQNGHIAVFSSAAPRSKNTTWHKISRNNKQWLVDSQRVLKNKFILQMN